MQPEFKQLLQIGMIVRDVDKAVRYYEDVLGMGPWTVSFMRGDEPPMEDLTVDGKPMPCIVSKLAFLNAYGIELELISISTFKMNDNKKENQTKQKKTNRIIINEP